MRPLRIIFDASPLLVNKTGIAYYTERLVTNLAERHSGELELVGFYYNFLGKRSTRHFPKRPNLRYKGVRIVPSKIIYQLRRWGVEWPVEFLAKTSADFVLYPNFFSYPSLSGMPNAPVIHDLTFIDLPQYVSRKNKQDLERFVPKSIERSSFVITVSDFTKQRICTTYNLKKDNILVTPIPPEPVRTFSAAQRAKILRSHNITKPYILFLGTVEPRKNLLNLMDAYTKLPERLRNTFTLVIAGRTGWNCDAEVAKMQGLRDKHFDIQHVGYVSEDARAILYQGAALFVSASSYEGFGMPVLEAMSYGIPVAVSDIPVFREVAGDAAVYFNQIRPEAIARVLQKILEDEDRRNKLSTKGRRHVANMRWDTIADDVYKRIILAIEKKKATS